MRRQHCAPENPVALLTRFVAYASTILASLIFAVVAVAEVPVGSAIKVCLLTPVSSYSSESGDKIDAVVIPSVSAARGNVFPEGTYVSGLVRHVRKVGLGLVHETAKVELEFNQVTLPDGRSYGIRTRLLEVENARERVDRNGSVQGIRATYGLSNRIGSRLAFAALGHPFLLIPLTVAESAFFRFPDPEIDFPRGTELRLRIEQPLP